jgi:hypothetical protein
VLMSVGSRDVTAKPSQEDQGLITAAGAPFATVSKKLDQKLVAALARVY